MKKFSKALPLLNKAITISPSNSRLYENRAYVYLQVKDLKNALENYQSARELTPDNINLRYMIAQVLSDMGRIKEASEAAENVLQLNANHPQAHIIIADYLRLSGKLNEALVHYHSAAKSIDTKAYAEHYIDLIAIEKEEAEAEKEFQEKINNSR